jgi:hypothetical protein
MEILNRRPEFAGCGILLPKIGGHQMPQEQPTASASLELDAEIVTTYVGRNRIRSDYLGSGLVTAA